MGLINQSEVETQLNQSNQPNLSNSQIVPQEKPTGNYALKDLVGAAFDRNNWVASLYNNGIGDISKSNTTFNPWDSIKDTPYETYGKDFVNADNEQEIEDTKKYIDKKNEEDKIFQEAGTGMTLLTTLAAGTLDPLFLIPGIGTIKAARTGAIATKTALTAGAATGAAIGAGEVVLSSNQPDRDLSESLVNVGAGAFIGGALGGIVGKLSTSSVKSAVEATKPVLAITEDTIPAIPNQAIRNLDAMAVERSTNPQMHISDNLELPDPNDPKIYSTDGHVSPFMKKYYAELEAEKFAQQTVDIQAPDVKLNEMPSTNPYETLTPEMSQSAGAAEALSTEGNKIADLPNWAIKAVQIPGLRNPSLEGLTDSSEIVREFTSRIFTVDARLEKNSAKMGFKETPISMEARNTMDLRETMDALNYNNEEFLRHSQIDPESMLPNVRAKLGGSMSKRTWNEEVIKAMNNGDTHEIPGVQNSARNLRKLFDKSWKKMEESGQIAPGTIKPDNWFMRHWDIPRILKNRTQFEDEVLTKDFMKHIRAKLIYTRDGAISKDGKPSQIEEVVDTFIRPNERAVENRTVPEGWKFQRLEPGEALTYEDAKEIASDTVDEILSLGEKELGMSDIRRVSMNRASNSITKGRVIDTPYEQIQDWVVKDLDSLVSTYQNNVSNSYNMAQVLKAFGVDNLSEMRKLIGSKAKEKVYTLQNTKSSTKEEIATMAKQDKETAKKMMTKEQKDAAIANIHKSTERSLNLFNDLAAISMGQFTQKSKADAFFRTLKSYNYLRMLGGVVWSSLSDPANMLIRNSLPDVMWNGLGKTLMQMFNGTWKIKTRDMKDLMTAVNNEMDNVLRVLYDPTAAEHLQGPIEKWSTTGANIFSRINGMNFWNNMWQRVAHNLQESKVLRQLKKYDTLSDKARSQLASYGIGPQDVKGILTMQEKYGANIRGTHLSNVRSWSDKNARDKFWNAMIKAVRQSPIMPGRGDIPRLVQKSELGKVLFQFKTFFAAATSKLLIPMMQNRDTNTAMAIVASTALGMINYTIGRKLIYNKEPDMSLNNLIYEGMNRSGILGLIADPAFNMVLKPIMTGKQRAQFHDSKYFGSDPLHYIFGPSSSALDPAWNSYLNVTKGSDAIDAQTRMQMKALVPGNNLFYIKALTNLINGGSTNTSPTPYYGRQ